jgi:hypothetical protein
MNNTTGQKGPVIDEANLDGTDVTSLLSGQGAMGNVVSALR